MLDGMQPHQELIGKIRWAVDIGCLYIMLETLLLSNYPAMPQVRHPEQAFHIFGYLKAHPKRKLDFDPQHPAINKKGSISVTGRVLIGTMRRRSQVLYQSQEANSCRQIVLFTIIMLVTQRQEYLRPAYCCFKTVRQ